jgi:hypothetical protein
MLDVHHNAPPSTVLPADVAAAFDGSHGAFGALNLLDAHLPSDERTVTLVRNAMTVDMAIGRTLEVPAYVDGVRSFGRRTAESHALVGLEDHERDVYRDHAEALATMEPRALAAALEAALPETIELVSLFSPKQCNLNCRGCYAAALPVDRHPFDDALVDDYFEGAVQVIRQARQAGARTVYTSGDGELTIFPRFFELLEAVEAEGLQWLFFTAGLSFSSERNAQATWAVSRTHLPEHIRARIETDIAGFERRADPKPTARALVQELARHRDSIQVYHSLWSPRPEVNEEWRRPLLDGYETEAVDVRGREIVLPSSLLDMMRVVFPEGHRHRLGIEMPVSAVSIEDVPAVATFVHDHGLRSYFEPVITTGRNTKSRLAAPAPESLAGVSSLLVRSLCSFRNIHQPTVKVLPRADGAGATLHVSPGMGVDVADLDRAGLAGSTQIAPRPDGLLAAMHSPLIVYTNYAFITGCKCDDFAQARLADPAAFELEWRQQAAALDPARIDVATVLSRLRAPLAA